MLSLTRVKKNANLKTINLKKLFFLVTVVLKKSYQAST